MVELIERNWKEYLSSSCKDMLFVRFVYDCEGNKLLRFAIVYATLIDDKATEVIRYDCSAKETLNVHKFYLCQNEKVFLEGKPSFDLMENLVGELRKNWFKYKLMFEEK